MSVWDPLHELLDQYDADFSTDVASGTGWGGTLRLTLTNPDDAPSRSITFHAAGGRTPIEVARRVLDDAADWLVESGVEPRPVPEWMRGGDDDRGAP